MVYFPQVSPLFTSPITHTCYMPRPSRSSCDIYTRLTKYSSISRHSIFRSTKTHMSCSFAPLIRQMITQNSLSMRTNGRSLGTCGYGKALSNIWELWTERYFQIFCWCFKDLTIKRWCAHSSASPRPQWCDNGRFPRFHWLCFSLHTGAICHRTWGKLWVHSAPAISWHNAVRAKWRAAASSLALRKAATALHRQMTRYNKHL